MHEEEILVTRPSMPPIEEYIEELRDIWESRWLTNMGAKHGELQQRLEKYLTVQHVDLLTNGHMALELSMQALRLTGEVITTPFTFASTTHAIVRNNLTPVFCDINENDYTIDVDKIENLITERTSAIVPVHVYGNICDVERIQEIADEHNLKVIYDAAHAFGVRYKGKGICSFGDVSCLSFHATKVFNTIEGGAVCFSDRNKDFGLDIYRLKNFGIRNEECVDAVGANAKMNEFCAAMGLCNLRHVNGEIQKRKGIAEIYREAFYDAEGLKLNPIQKDVETNDSYFPIMVDEKAFGASRDVVRAKLAENNVFVRKYFYPLTNTFEAFHGMYDAEKTPIALKYSHQVLTLPMFADLSPEDAGRIADIVLSCKK